MKTLSTMAIAALVVSAVAFSAQGAGERESLSFPYEPHETSTVEGAAALLQRIEFYARGQCRLIKDRGLPNPKSKECAADMVKQLVASIDSPLLHRAARGKGPTLAALAQ
jgi:UrcA family protein